MAPSTESITHVVKNKNVYFTFNKEDHMLNKAMKNTIYSFATNPGSLPRRRPAEKADISIPTNGMLIADYLD